MSERVFSRQCGKCRQRAVALAAMPYSIQIDHDGRKHTVTLDSIELPKCANCGAISIDADAEKAIYDAFRRQVHLLTPEQIRSGREHRQLTQQQFAELLGVAATTISRWEMGLQIQPRSLDRLMRAFFDLPALREFLDVRRRTEAGEASAEPAFPEPVSPLGG